MIQQDSPPNFNYGSGLCNNLHAASAKCLNDLNYDIFDGEESDSTECSYIEAIRFGTFDEKGNVAAAESGVTSWNAEVSIPQKIMLAFSIFACVCFVVYAGYLHHAMTNLLIKSLSHRELLPPSRHARRRTSTPGSRRGNRSLQEGDSDWQKSSMQ